ncbi:MAG TPA: hypothetical protein VKF59_09405 [Candidatus Dormibacteraeota bacterium]|nr:hypothetical protein [Candidatus Dormibacteraeota bacterium]
MLEDIAAYLALAPVVGTIVLGVTIVLWLSGRRPLPARVRVLSRRRPR